MKYSERERVSHVVRRLAMGGHGPLLPEFSSVEEAIADSIDVSGPAPEFPSFKFPKDLQEARNRDDLGKMIRAWLEAMRSPHRRLEERMTWFWHDHFAVSARKVPAYNLLWTYLHTLRRHAVGRFDELLHATAIDGAMLIYLDGATNRASAINENYAREVMELHTLGLGNYSQEDITEAARALTGWVVAIPGERRRIPRDIEPWSSIFVSQRHDDGLKTIFGETRRFDPEGVIDLLLDHPSTARTVAAKLYHHLVGSPPSESTVDRLAKTFASDWKILRLVEEITADPAFVADEAIRSRVRTPVERAATIAQGFRDPEDDLPEGFPLVLARLGYIPLAPPNPAGYPSDDLLLGPYQLAHGLDLLHAATDVAEADVDAVLARLGIFDVSRATRLTLEQYADDPESLLALAVSSPEFALV